MQRARGARVIYDIELETFDATGWMKVRPAEQKHKAADVHIAANPRQPPEPWSKDVVDCLLADMKAEQSGGTRPDCRNSPPVELAASAFGDAEERALRLVFGSDELDREARELEDALKEAESNLKRWQERRASRIEPRVTIPAHYRGFAWFRARRVHSLTSPVACRRAPAAYS